MSTPKNTGSDYELFAQGIYQRFLDEEDIKPINVQHNVNLLGRSGCFHQIDVFWEYELAGVKHKVAVECKNFTTSNVPIGKIRDFFGALTDIGDINGVFVCMKGYQSGAINFAKYYGINLKELRVPTLTDWEERVKSFQIDLVAISFNIHNREPVIDFNWLQKNHNIKTGATFSIAGLNNDLIILDSNGNTITNFYDLDNGLPHNWKAENSKTHEYNYDDAYIDVPNLGSVKIDAVKYTYDVNVTDPHVIEINGEEVAEAILKDVNTGDIKFFNKEPD